MSSSFDFKSKVFLRWCNFILLERKLKVQSVEDFSDGILLANLLEILFSVTLKINKTPRMRLHKLENLTVCMNTMHKAGVKTVGISAEDISDARITLGLLWSIILRSQFGDVQNPKLSLLSWAQPLLCNPTAPNPSSDTLSISAIFTPQKFLTLLANLYPGSTFSTLSSTSSSLSSTSSSEISSQLEKALQFTATHMEVPHLLEPQDLLEEDPMDELVGVLFLSYLKKFDDLCKEGKRDRWKSEKLRLLACAHFLDNASPLHQTRFPTDLLKSVLHELNYIK